MADYTQYYAGIISICNWVSEAPGFSDVMEDHPFVLGPGTTVFDQVDIIRSWGRDPADDEPLFVNELAVDRLKADVVSQGVSNQSARTTPPSGNPIDASLCQAGLTTAGSIQAIDEDATYLAWGMWAKGQVNDQGALPPALQDWWVDAPVTVERKEAFDAFMLARGTDPLTLSNYWLTHPDATYRTVGKDFGLFL